MQWDNNAFFALNALAGQSALVDGLIVFTATYLPFILVGAFGVYIFTRTSTFGRKVSIISFALLAGLIARVGIGSPIRYFFPRMRPFLTHQVYQLIFVHAPSFPSGHALFFFAFSTVAYCYDRKFGAVAFLASVLICLARVAAGIHYPSDILAGALLGSAAGWLLWHYGKIPMGLPPKRR